ncbi:uncharacterized protein LOC131875815 [Cryptomeria japonica]|uniref:uncharacterized protein LOC131875815 n=1 Tax=Cryptomeria japonica TaxID=3369 RepID=UPI0027DA4A2F|nr:uncharacterized protein LOC131875815 [Cryptomeria japonica]
MNTSALPITISFDIANTLTQMKVFVPLLEMMKFPEYREKTLKVINGVSEEKSKEHKQNGAAINVMPVGVMKELGMEVDTNFGKCYAMDNHFVPVVGVMKDVEFKQWSNLIGGHVELDLSYATIPVNGQEVRIEREPHSEYIIEEAEPVESVCFIQSDIDNFKVELKKPKTQSLTPIESSVKENKDQVWRMYFDGSCSKEGSGARIIFISPDGEMFKYSFKLIFECTNNIAEYEALLTGLNVATKHGIKLLSVFGDSELVISQIKQKYASKHLRLKQYRDAVWDTIELFDAFQISWIDRSNNIMADFLANVSLKGNDITLNGVSECVDHYQAQAINFNDFGERTDGKETLFG